MHPTVAFSRSAANVFFHILTQCNLSCRHCYINPAQHGRRRLSLATIEKWLKILIERSPGANLVLLGGEPTLHPGLAGAVHAARRLGYASVTIDTNGFLFNAILERVSPEQVDFFSFSLDGATAATNDAIRGEGTFKTCTAGITRARAAGFRTSLIYTASRRNLEELHQMPDLLVRLGVDRFFIQVIGLRGRSTSTGQGGPEQDLQVTPDAWLRTVPRAAAEVVRRGIPVTYPKVYLSPDELFACAGRVADNYFVFPNGRVYRCPLSEDFPLHSLEFGPQGLQAAAPVNEKDLFGLDVAEGCVMNKLIQSGNLAYGPEGRPLFKVACCLLKEQLAP